MYNKLHEVNNYNDMFLYYLYCPRRPENDVILYLTFRYKYIVACNDLVYLYFERVMYSRLFFVLSLIMYLYKQFTRNIKYIYGNAIAGS